MSGPGRTATAPGWQVDEQTRAALLASYDLDQLRQSAALTSITDFAAKLCAAPIALVTLLDETDQHFLARTGTGLAGSPRSISFCTHAIRGDTLMEVTDAAADARFAQNPLVTGPPHVRFYAGVPLITEDGVALGSLCVLDTESRPGGLTALQRQGLDCLADNVMARLRDSRDAAAWRRAENEAARRLDDSETRFHTLADTMPQMVWSSLPDGFHDYYNARWYEFTGVPEGSTDGEAWNGMFHPDDQERAWATWRHSLSTGDPYQIEYRLRHRSGAYRWVLGRALPIRDDAGRITRWFGTCTDIHEQKTAADARDVVAQELSHRIKNIFAVVSGLIGFAARSRPELGAVAGDLRERIAALGRAHDFVRPHSQWSGPTRRQDSLKGLLDELIAPYRRDGGGIVIRGDDPPIDDRAATPLALLFHELATNAAKYGALSTETGLVTLTVRQTATALTLDWVETGGPPVVQSGTSGFGSQLIELAAMRQLGGSVTRDWRPEGLALRIVLPPSALGGA